jgi:hypothetical protein
MVRAERYHPSAFQAQGGNRPGTVTPVGTAEQHSVHVWLSGSVPSRIQGINCHTKDVTSSCGFTHHVCVERRARPHTVMFVFTLRSIAGINVNWYRTFFLALFKGGNTDGSSSDGPGERAHALRLWRLITDYRACGRCNFDNQPWISSGCMQ